MEGTFAMGEAFGDDPQNRVAATGGDAFGIGQTTGFDGGHTFFHLGGLAGGGCSDPPDYPLRDHGDGKDHHDGNRPHDGAAVAKEFNHYIGQRQTHRIWYKMGMR